MFEHWCREQDWSKRGKGSLGIPGVSPQLGNTADDR